MTTISQTHGLAANWQNRFARLVVHQDSAADQFRAAQKLYRKWVAATQGVLQTAEQILAVYKTTVDVRALHDWQSTFTGSAPGVPIVAADLGCHVPHDWASELAAYSSHKDCLVAANRAALGDLLLVSPVRGSEASEGSSSQKFRADLNELLRRVLDQWLSPEDATARALRTLSADVFGDVHVDVELEQSDEDGELTYCVYVSVPGGTSDEVAMEWWSDFHLALERGLDGADANANVALLYVWDQE